jgi:hypothetical protein
MLGLSFRRSSPTLRQNLLVSNSVSKATRGLYLLSIVLLIAASKLPLFPPSTESAVVHQRPVAARLIRLSCIDGHRPATRFVRSQFLTQDGAVTGGALTSAVNLNNPLANQFK